MRENGPAKKSNQYKAERSRMRVMYAIIYNVVSNPRERMVVSAALLIRERGAQATAISDVLKHSRAPRGSAYHYFPGGRMQLLEEATDYAGAYIAGKISAAESAAVLLDELIGMYREQLIRSDYRAGCPIVAVTVEAGDPDNAERTTKVIERAAAAFALWTDLIRQRLVAEGVAAARAEELAMLVTTSIEGAIIVARASREVKPLDLIQHQLRGLLDAATAEGKSS